MGNSMEKPITEMSWTSSGDFESNFSTSTSHSSKNKNYSNGSKAYWGVASMQGWRPTMEDAHICQQILPPIPSTSGSGDCSGGGGGAFPNEKNASNNNNDSSGSNTNTVHLFCVLDGHGGTLAAEYTSQHLPSILLEQPTFQEYAIATGHVLTNQSNNCNQGNNSNSNSNSNNKTKHKKQKRFLTTSSTKQRQEQFKQQNEKSKQIRQQQKQYDQEYLRRLLQRALEDAFVELDIRLLNHMVHNGEYKLPGYIHNNNNDNNGDDDGDDDSGEWNPDLADVDSADAPPPDHFPKSANSASGTTATAVLVTPDFFVCANVGDSRAVLMVQSIEEQSDDKNNDKKTKSKNNNNNNKPKRNTKNQSYNNDNDNDDTGDIIIIPLSNDHKPTLPEETSRIQSAGGSVYFDRVDGELAVSRALGDFEFKNYSHYAIIPKESTTSSKNNTNNNNNTEASDVAMAGSKGIVDMEEKRTEAQALKVSPFPEVIIHSRNNQEDSSAAAGTTTTTTGSFCYLDQLLVIACDGIWDVVSNEECMALIDEILQEGERDMGLVCEEMLETCLKKGSRDNMTIIIVRFPGQPIGTGGGVQKRRKQRQQQQQG